MRLPESWGLKTKKRDDGKLDIIGKDDAGQEYRVRTTDAPEVRDVDVAELALADREQYRPETRARDFVQHLMSGDKQRKQQREEVLMEDLTEAAGPVVYAGLERKGSTTGYSRRYAQNFDSIFGKAN